MIYFYALFLFHLYKRRSKLLDIVVMANEYGLMPYVVLFLVITITILIPSTKISINSQHPLCLILIHCMYGFSIFTRYAIFCAISYCTWTTIL